MPGPFPSRVEHCAARCPNGESPNDQELRTDRQPNYREDTPGQVLYIERMFAILHHMSSAADPANVLRAVLPGDVAALDAAQASDALGRVRAIRGFLDAYEARVTSHIRGLHRSGASAPAADLHTRDGGVSSKEARQKERRAEALEQAPALADKLADGSVTAAHADALANASSRLDDDVKRDLFDHQDAIATDAARMTPEEFARSLRDLVRVLERDQGIERDRRQRRETRLTKRIDRDGMYTLTARLHPELGHTIFNAIDAQVAKRIKAGADRTVDRSQLAADALGDLVTGGHQAIRPAEAEIRIHIDAATLLGATHSDGVCEYDDGIPLPPPTVRRLVCNGRIVPIVVDANGVVLDAGREQRLANRHQRRALRAMYSTCAFHGCDVPFNQCEVHHIHPFELGGRTDLANLIPLCSRHHHVIHEPGWTLDLAPDRTLTIRRLDEVFAVVPLDRCQPSKPDAPPGRRPPDDADPPHDHPPDATPDHEHQLTLVA